MRLLLDSHVLLWYDTSVVLSPATRRAVDSAESLFVSVATIWELTLKQQLGKLQLRMPVRNIAEGSGAELLRIDAAHAQLAGELPLHHRDPFDRMLVAQALLEDLTLVTRDSALQQYGAATLLV